LIINEDENDVGLHCCAGIHRVADDLQDDQDGKTI
jgi:hypothetical protein